VDGAANQAAILACGPIEAASFLLGGHPDAVHNGERFDKALGILCGLEVLHVVKGTKEKTDQWSIVH
jgi:hypothetical protein